MLPPAEVGSGNVAGGGVIPAVPAMNYYDPMATAEGRRGLAEALPYDPHGPSKFQFPTNIGFWDNLVEFVNNTPQKKPFFQVSTSHMQGEILRINQQLFVGFVKGWEEANPHRVCVIGPDGAEEEFHASRKFWNEVLGRLRKHGTPLSRIAPQNMIAIKSSAHHGPPDYADINEWNQAVGEWERENNLTPEDLLRAKIQRAENRATEREREREREPARVQQRAAAAAAAAAEAAAAAAAEEAAAAAAAQKRQRKEKRRRERERGSGRRSSSPTRGSRTVPLPPESSCGSVASSLLSDGLRSKPSAVLRGNRMSFSTSKSPAPAPAPSAHNPFAALQHQPPPAGMPPGIPPAPANSGPGGGMAFPQQDNFWKYGVLHYHVHQH